MPVGPRQRLLEIFGSAVAAVNGHACVRRYLHTHPVAAPVYLIAIGKAACAMARGAQDALGAAVRDAFIVTKRGYAEDLPWPVRVAGHPLPDEASIEAGTALLEFSARIPAAGRVLVLLSGGASALVEVLPDGVDLKRLREINRWLLASGRDIAACNRIRKRLSLIKGGRLAELLAPRPILGLAIADVPGDDPRVIGSGPLTADADLQRPVDSSGLPDFVREALAHGPPAPAPDAECFRQVRYEIVATLEDAKRAAAQAARKLGHEVVIEPEFVSGAAAAAGARLARGLLQSAAGAVHVWGGETTVRLPEAPGRGGRNQSLALAAALVLRGHENVWLLAAATDGSDGPTEDAGALVDGGTIGRGTDAGLDADESLARADAGEFLEASGDLIQTGPTGTNVMDIILGLRTEDSGLRTQD